MSTEFEPWATAIAPQWAGNEMYEHLDERQSQSEFSILLGHKLGHRTLEYGRTMISILQRTYLMK